MMNWFVIVFAASFATPSMQEIIPVQGSKTYSLTFWQAFQKCFDMGAALASPQELEEAVAAGHSHCSCGWLNDHTARFPMSEAVPSCGGRKGVHQCTWSKKYNAFCFMGDPLGNCSKPLGMENGAIGDRQLTSSSAYHTFWTDRWEPRLARLNKEGVVNAWMPHHDGRNQYIEVDLGRAMAVTGIITQGVRRYLRNQYVTQYKLKFSKAGDFWLYYGDSDNMEKIFEGNTDNNGRVRNMLQRPILARFLRIYPYHWQRHISLRFELLGCELSTYDQAVQRQRETEVMAMDEGFVEREPPEMN
ncbi:unnamed protein product [Clavelina lepadiformis]|uniref:Uncharacterized protein n=1 Tax=Clavelina lepadiformis TaxID=159417 RepID=A0ABP0GD55_CLALP